ncbi:hypothetical protein ACNFH8_02425 [Pseudomonas sp. NY15436]|uniref:hypothetical protein n=1 Tax=Pseudomonas sp. NY15436 TaxID=3400359 RepID=UPI003A84F7E1
MLQLKPSGAWRRQATKDCEVLEMTGRNGEHSVVLAAKQQRLLDFIRRVGGYPRSAEEHAELQSLLAAASEAYFGSVDRGRTQQ